MSTFEPYQMMRDTVQQFCEKHFSSIKDYMDKLSQRLPPPTRCTIEGNYWHNKQTSQPTNTINVLD